jgi:adenylate cyclase class 2
MSYEVEIKFRSAQHDSLRRRLEECGAVEASPVVQVDTYLIHPSRDFAQTGEALRLRRTGAENRITYKGPRYDGPTKTREEIEIPMAEGEETFRQLTRLFERLGFRPIASIRKTRSTFHFSDPPHPIEVVLDRVEGLGDFAEIEIVAASESELPAAQAAVLGVADRFGLTAIEPRSYLRMVLEARAQEPAIYPSAIEDRSEPELRSS